MTIIPFISSGVGVLPPVPPSTHLVVFTYYTADPAGYNVGLYDPITNELGPVIASGGEPLGKPSWVHDHAHIAVPHVYSSGFVHLLAADGSSDVDVGSSGGTWTTGVSSACYSNRIFSTTVSELGDESVMFSYNQDGSGDRAFTDASGLVVRGNSTVDQWKGIYTPAIVNPVSGVIAYSTLAGVRIRSQGGFEKLCYADTAVCAATSWQDNGTSIYVQTSSGAIKWINVNTNGIVDQWSLPAGVDAGPAAPVDLSGETFMYVAFAGSHLRVYNLNELMHEIVTPADVLIGADWYWGAS